MFSFWVNFICAKKQALFKSCELPKYGKSSFQSVRNYQ